MLPDFKALLAPMLVDPLVDPLVNRLVLLINHVLGAEPEALRRLLPHAGRVMQLELVSLPRILRPPQHLSLVVTPAGLVARCDADSSSGLLNSPNRRQPDLTVRVDAGNPAMLALRAIQGDLPGVDIRGDAQLAADIDWLMRNLRWDVERDLERLFGPAVAHELHKFGRAVAQGMRRAVAGASALAGRG